MKQKKIYKNILELKEKGFFHIFSSNILNKIIQFCSGIFIIRVLTKFDYGIFTYSQNLLSFFLLINGFGITISFLQFGSKAKNEEEKLKLCKYTIKIAIFSSFMIFLAIIFYAKFGMFKIEKARNIFLAMCFYPLMAIILEIIQLKNRIEFQNKKMAFLSNVNIVFSLTLMILGGKIFGVYGVIVGKYIGNFIAILFGFKDIKGILKIWNEIKKLEKEEEKKIKKYSFVTMINNAISQLLYIMDIFLIGIIIGGELQIASYKTATLIPFALNFIPLSIMTYLYPYLARNGNDKKWMFKSYKKLIYITGIINIVISLFLFLFAKNIILLLFGESYLDSVSSFKILAIGYFFSATLRIPVGHVLASMEKLKFNFYNTIFCGILNIVFDIFLIKKYGSIGAAITTTSIFIISGIIGNILLLKYLKKN